MSEVIPEDEGCSHYKRGCKLLAPCCNKSYNCRFCHDEEEENHTLDRQAVEQVECLGCRLLQLVVAECKSCSHVFGSAYFCPTCKLYDHTDKGQFHCDGCGICRAGGRDKFNHCSTCGICMPVDKPHRCISNSSKNNCAVCMEDIHTSRDSAHIPSCSHLLHSKCFKDMISQGMYTCPTCSKSMMDMEDVWQNVDREVADTPMPREYSNLFRAIICKDCNKSSTTAFHVVGMKCGGCGSYNTSLDKGPLLRQEEGEDGQNAFVPLTEEELTRLNNVPIQVPEERDGDTSEDEDEEGQNRELMEEDLD